jgi:hypothetical protein
MNRAVKGYTGHQQSLEFAITAMKTFTGDKMRELLKLENGSSGAQPRQASLDFAKGYSSAMPGKVTHHALERLLRNMRRACKEPC